jgi:hypothetical protein
MSVVAGISPPREEAAAAGGGDHAGDAQGEEAPAVSLSRRQLRTLRGIERGLARSEPALDAWFLSFAAGVRGCDMPQVERIPRWPSRMLGRVWRGPGVSARVAAWYAENWREP